MTLMLISCGGGGGGSSVPTTPAASLPGTPMAMSAVAGNTAVTMGWSVVTAATSYNIYRSTASGTEAKIASSKAASYSDTSVANGTTYYYVVTAVNGKGEGGRSSEVSATPNLPSGSILISGTVLYEDKEYGISGFTGNKPYKAVRYASVELVTELSPTVIGTTQTDSNGAYGLLTTPTTSAVYVRIKTEATLGGITPQIAVKSLSGSTYAAAGNNFIPSGSASVNIAVPATSIGGAFNILDVFTSGVQFVFSLSGTYPPVTLSGFWQKNNPYGTYYCSSGCFPGAGIYVLNYSGDTDEYDDDVLYHEFGHFTAAHFSKDDSQGGPHGLTDNDLDMRLAWSEGWGDSMPGAIKMWLNTATPDLLSSASGLPLTEYVDTYGNGAGIAFDMGNPVGSSYMYASGEVAIAKILLDLNKDFGMQPVWDVISFFTTTTSIINLDTFWDGWHVLSLPTTTASISIDSIFNGRQILYSDSTATSIQLSTPQAHNIYPDGGFDLVSFSTITGQHYTIVTSNLTNGADTLITLYDPTLVQSAVTGNPNDNANGDAYSGLTVPSDLNPALIDSYGIQHENASDILSSQLSFIAASAGPYYVKIQSSTARPVSASKYGSYALTITSP